MMKKWFNFKGKRKTRQFHKPDDVAIIGIACRLPGADNYKEFWRNLENGVNSIREISKDRWDIKQFYSPDHSAPNKSVSKWGGLLQHIDTFDSHFFHISPREAEMMDPQQRILLEETWHCIEDAGIALTDLQNGNTSVYVGAMASDYHQYLVQPEHITNGYDCLGNYPSILSNRLSYFFNFTGESISIDAACASSLVSIHEAKESLISGKSQYAIAAGVSVICHPWKYISFSKARMLSPDGQCKTFDAAANGYVPGEGVGVLLLESLENAIKNGHTIYGVIKGSGVHHGGKSKSITAPSLDAQQKLITEVMRNSGISSESISYIEAHGTGTSLGDPIEVAALTKAFNTEQKQYCVIGSVKTNFGHLEGAAGVAGTIKVLMMLKHRKIPKTLNISTLNPIINFEQSPFRVADQIQEWNLLPSQELRRAGISSFGFGGVDAHLILEEYIPNPIKQAGKMQNTLPFVLSAESRESLDNLIMDWQHYVKSPEFAKLSLENITWNLLQTRKPFRYKWGSIVQSKRELVQMLRYATQTKDSQLALDKRTLILRINPEMDLDYASFHVITQEYPILKQLVSECKTALFQLKNGKQIVKNLPQNESKEYKNLRNFIAYYSLSKGLLLSGLKPQILLGSSIGELVEAVLANMLSLQDAMEALLESHMPIKLRRPEISIYEKHNQTMLNPYIVLKNYCHKLTQKINISNQDFKVLVDRSKLLVINQFTFKKFLAGWDKVFEKYDISLGKSFSSMSSKKRTVLCISILYSMKKLNTKWDLEEKSGIENIAINEIVDLLLDQVLSYGEVANLIINPDDAIKESTATIIQKQEKRLNSEKPYYILKALNQSVSDISDPELWLQKIIDDHSTIGTIPHDTELHFFIDLGIEYSPVENSHVFLDMHNLSDSIPEFLLQLWLHGIHINWENWYDFGAHARASSLPLYPFLPEKHWFSLIEEPQIEQASFEKILSDKHTYLRDHVVRENIVLPAALYLEWIREAAEKERLVFTEFHNILWAKPVLITHALTILTIQFDTQKKPNKFQLITTENSQKIIHAEGSIIYQEHKQHPQNLNIDIMKNEFKFDRDKNEIYEHFNKIGLHYGPFYQVIENYWRNENEALAELSVSLEQNDEFILHPGILDGALQTCICLLKDRESLYLPFSMDNLEIFDLKFTPACYIWAQIIPDSESHHLPKFNIQITNNSGTVLIQIKHFSLRAVHLENKEPGIYYYHPEWVQEPLGKIPFQAPLLMFNDDKKQVMFFKKSYPHLTINHVSVEENNFHDLIGDLIKENSFYPTIIYKNSLYLEEHFSDASIHHQLQHSFFAMLSLVKAIMKHKIHQPINILFVNETPNEKATLFTEALSGFIQTLHVENPGISCRMLHIPASEKTMEFIYEELGMHDRDVRYTSQWQRLVKHFKEIKPIVHEKPILRNKGVYLISGGAGGLGQILASYLAKTYQAKMIFIGRSELNDVQKKRNEELEKSGAQVHYLRFDIANLSQMDALKNAIQNVVKIFGPINGVFHAAGLLKDAFILEKNTEDAEKVLAPKVYGTYVLDQITQDQPLDFFIMFSSMVSIFGNVGQCDYAYANNFMDTYAGFREQLQKEHKRQGKSIAINLPLWAEGGMQINEVYQAGLLNKLGLISLETKKGIAAFMEALQQDYTQFVVLSGYKNKIERALKEHSKIETIHAHEKSKSDTDELINIENFEDQATELLKSILSESLKIAPEKINAQEHFELYGIDSLMIVNLNQVLENTFGELPQTLFFEYLTLEELVIYFTENHKEILLKILQLNQPETIENPEPKLQKIPETPAEPLKMVQINHPEIIEYSAPKIQKIPETHEEIMNVPREDSDIAIIGFSGKYPQANDLDTFWENLKNGKDNITEIPETRWNYRDYFDTDKDKPGKIYSKWGGFIEDIDQFDPLFFNITPNEATYMDPQERLFLETAWNAIEDAGYTKNSLSNKQIGVFVGVMYDEYQFFGVEESLKGHIIATNPLYAYIANRVSYYFNFHGPSISLDTMCSSSLTTVHLACQSIKQGECELAIAGGVNLNLHPNKYIFLSRGKFLASDGRCKSFGVGGDGYVPGEGVGAILLKPLSKALKDGDHIYGVIKGSSINHCGKTNGFTVPSPTAQAALIESSLKNARLDPDSISYVEAHGTGTSLGDPIEMTGLNKAFGNSKTTKAIGSVKSNIGHLESAAGIAAISKVLLQMRYKHLVPSIHSQTLNPNINWKTTPFVVQQNYAAWDSPQYPRRASISSFGAGGSNANVIIEEAPETLPEKDTKPWYLIPLSAKTEKALLQKSKDLQAWISHKEQQNETLSLSSLSYTLQVGREHFNHKTVYLVDSITTLKTALATNQIIPSENNPTSPVELQKDLANTLLHQLTQNIDPQEYKDKLQQLAHLYRQNTNIDWSLMYPGTPPHKVPLPTYPFEKKSYWLEQTAAGIAFSATAITPHPLLDNTSSPEHLFSKVMHPDAFYLRDHIVLGNALLPGTAYLELVRASGSFDAQKEITMIKDMFWERPFIIEKESKTVFVQLDSGNFKIYQKDAGENLVCSEGKIGYEEPSIMPSLNLDAIRSRCSFIINKETIYKNLTAMGFDYGPSFQVSNKAWINDTEVLIELELPEFMRDGASQFTLHPSLMDGALRATFGHEYTHMEAAVLRVPFTMNSLYIYKPVNDTCWAYAQSSANTPDIFDITITNPSGEVLVFIHGFLTRAMKKTTNTTESILLYKPEWTPFPIQLKATVASTPVVIFAKEIFPLPDTIQPIWVKPGTQYRKLSDNEYHLKPDDAEDYQLLFADLNNQKIVIQYLLHLLNVPDAKRTEGLSIGLYSLTALCHALKKIDDLRILFVFESPQPDDYPPLEAVSGFMHTMKILKPTWNMSMLEMDKVEYTNVFLELLNPSAPDIRYQQTERLIRIFQELKTPIQTESIAFKKQGTYLITGGLGGLGKLFAEYLADNYQARLILAGRRALDADLQKAIHALEHKGAEVLYVSGDITRLEDVEYIFKTAKEKWNQINGIFHAAGVFPTKSFFDVTQNEFNQAIAPKISGTLYLDKVSARENLDYFIVFSSISSELGDYGSGSYATGNRFMDSYITLRARLVTKGERKGKSLSINWPYWEDGGMHLSKEEATVYFDYLGMKAIKNTTGLKIFEHILSLNYPQVLVVEGDRGKIEKALGKSVVVPKVTSEPGKSRVENKTDLQGSTEHYLKEILYGITQIPVEELDSNTPLEEYGIDSVMILKFNTALNKHFSQLRNTLLFEYRTLSTLAEYLILEKQDELLKLITVPETPSKSAAPAEPSSEKIITEQHPHTPSTTLNTKEEIAVIGISGRYPAAYDLKEFWDNLKNGKDCIEEIPKNRWDFEPVFVPNEIHPGKTVSKWGGFIEDADTFDPLFFNISAREAEQMDPQERLFLEIVWTTLEDAGYTPEALRKSSQGKIGVYAGVMWNEYQLFQGDNSSALFASNNSALANRISYFLDIHGPSMVLDTACSSSLVAIHLACESILQGHCTYAIAGGVNLSLTPQKYITLSQLGMLSKQGRCRSFGDGSDGYVPGEGVGAVLLKPLSKAIADGDRIYAVIKGSSMNHGGKTHGYTVPNPDAQAAVISEALEKSGISADTISYIEAHGTGTPLGDPIEITGLCKAFGADVPKQSCSIGSVKSNIGHLEGAAGISAFTKVILQLQNRQIVPSLHAQTLNPYVDFLNTPFRVQQMLQPWNSASNQPLRAGISSFGAGGANAHVVVESGPINPVSENATKSHYLVTLSAKTESALQHKISDLATWMQDPENAPLSLADISYTLNAGRVSFEKRCAIVSNSIDDLLKQLTSGTGLMGAYNKKEYAAHGNNWKASGDLLIQELGNTSLAPESRQEKLRALASLYVSGLDLPWISLYPDEKRKKIALPTYPFARERYWLTSAKLTNKPESVTEVNDDQFSTKAVIFIRKMIAEATKIDISRIDSEANFEEFGIDSIMITRLNQSLEKYFDKLPPTLFFTWHTAQELADYFMKHHADRLKVLLNTPDTAVVINQNKSESEREKMSSVLKPAAKSKGSDDIAIIGYSGQFPEAKTNIEYWENLKAGKNSITEIPSSRWDYKKYYEEIKDKRDITSGKIYCKWGGFLENVDRFDADLFHISPKDAIFMDPQERLFMQCVWSTIEAAGYTPETLTKKDSAEQVGVFVGVSFNNYQLVCAEAMQQDNLVPVVDSQIFSVANRVSYFFNFHGPSIPLDTACSSSLYAIHLACESIQRGECAIAVAGATNLTLHPSKYATLCSGGFLANDGICHAFGEGGDGYVPGEGVGAVLLKSLAQAIEDNDFIYGVIKGSAISHDGKTNGYTVPNPIAQAKAIEKALTNANMDPRTISYVEAHGTGTQLGDPVEIAGLCEVYQRNNSEKQYCAIGSVKTNIGHLESAAGMAQIMKVLLQMSNETLVPNLLHGRKLNPGIDFQNTPFYVEQGLEYWKQPEINGSIFSRRAGISSFGAGGTNAHVVLEEYQNQEVTHTVPNPLHNLIILSAPSEEQLQDYAQSLLEFLRKYQTKNPITGKALALENIAFTLQTGRVAFNHRMALKVNSLHELTEKLSLYTQGKSATQIYQGIVAISANRPKIDPRHETKPEALAELWIAGNNVLWHNAYTENAPQRMYLPTYIFKKPRFWVNSIEKPEPIPQKQVASIIESPVIHNKKASEVSFLKSINTATEAENIKKIMRYCQQKIGAILDYPESQLPDPDKGFFDLGLESLLAMKLHKELEDELGISIPDTSMFNYPTIRDIAKFFLELISAQNIPNEKNIDLDIKSMADNNKKNDDLDIESMSEAEVIASLNALLPPQE